MKVLVVDDSPRIRLIMTRQLKTLGLEDLTEAQDAPSVLTYLEQSTPDVVFLDIMLPGAEDTNLLKAILQKNIEAKVILVTSLGRHDPRVEKLISNGAYAYLEKPFYHVDLKELVTRIQSERRKTEEKGRGESHILTSDEGKRLALNAIRKLAKKGINTILVSTASPAYFQQQFGLGDKKNVKILLAK